MRVASFPVVESDIEFDFSAAIWCEKHDATNKVFPGIDFILDEPDRQVWLEVKNWQGVSIPPRRRGGQMRSFLAKVASRQFFTDTLRAKFTGTCASFWLTGRMPAKPILYVVLLEAPPRMDAFLMSASTNRLRNLVVSSAFPPSVDAIVVNLGEWQARFPQYPARALP